MTIEDSIELIEERLLYLERFLEALADSLGFEIDEKDYPYLISLKKKGNK